MKGHLVVKITEEYGDDIACMPMNDKSQIEAFLLAVLQDAASSVSHVELLSQDSD